MAKIVIKNDNLTSFGGIFPLMEKLTQDLSPIINNILGYRCKSAGYQYDEIIRSLASVYLCGGSCVEDMSRHLKSQLKLHPYLRTCSADATLRAIKVLTTENISYISDKGITYQFNKNNRLNTLLIAALI